MTLQKSILKILLIQICFLLVCPSVIPRPQGNIPLQPSRVYLKGTQLIVEKRLSDNSLEKPRAYIIKGVTWDPATRAPDQGPDPSNSRKTIPYGFFFNWPGRNPQGHEIFNYWSKSQYLHYYLVDIPLLKQMNVNTVRVYADFGDDPIAYTKILDEFYRNDIMVIMTPVVSKKDITSKRYLKVVKRCKNHPAILMWCLGNEWNLDYCKYWGYATVAKATKATNNAAAAIKKADPNHPVSSCLGDRFTDPEPSNTIEWIIDNCPNVDVWGLNIYRGKSFGSLFDQWRKISLKPFYLSEFGTDSFRTSTYKILDGYKADDCEGVEDQDMQAEFNLILWKQLTAYLSALNIDGYCLGGLIHSFNDTLSKVGCYHYGLGGLINYYSKEYRNYKERDNEGFRIPGGHPDDIANEEYFGVVDADRIPKKAFWKLQQFYKEL